MSSSMSPRRARWCTSPGRRGPVSERWCGSIGTAIRRPRHAEKRAYSGARLSPDGHTVATTIEGPPNSLWSYDLVRGAWKRLTFDGHVTTPAWTPDGAHLFVRTPSAERGTRHLSDRHEWRRHARTLDLAADAAKRHARRRVRAAGPRSSPYRTRQAMTSIRCRSTRRTRSHPFRQRRRTRRRRRFRQADGTSRIRQPSRADGKSTSALSPDPPARGPSPRAAAPRLGGGGMSVSCSISLVPA